MELSHAAKWARTAGGVSLSELYQLLCRLQWGWSLHQVLCHWLADKLLSISLQRLVQHPVSHQKEPGVVSWWLHPWWWRDDWVHCQSAQPIFQESPLSQWSVLNHLHWGGVMILRWWAHRLLSGHHRSSSCCSYLQSLGSHQLCCSAMNPAFGTALVG